MIPRASVRASVGILWKRRERLWMYMPIYCSALSVCMLVYMLTALALNREQLGGSGVIESMLSRRWREDSMYAGWVVAIFCRCRSTQMPRW